MTPWPACPLLYEINTWLWLRELTERTGSRVTLATVPDEELERLAAWGFDAVWMMGVWRRSAGARATSLARTDLQEAYRHALPDFSPDDIAGSPYAIPAYAVDPVLGGDEALATLRERLHKAGLRLMLDFVPNHVAIDHPWRREHPEYLVPGTADELAAKPRNLVRDAETGRILAYGRDPYFDGWPDTLQIDYRRPAARRAMAGELQRIAARCDGARCDMAMLATHGVFLRTWGGTFEPPGTEFWPETIAAVKAQHPEFVFLAEVYWDLESLLQEQGFDFTYDKRLYDRLIEDDTLKVRESLGAPVAFQRRLCRFIENHDERRAVEAFGRERARAAALLTLAAPGMRLVHEGQETGRRARLPVELGRRPAEPPDPEVTVFYRSLLDALRAPVLRKGTWRLLAASPDRVVAFAWSLESEYRLVVANLSAEPVRASLRLDLPGLREPAYLLQDLVGDVTLECNAEALSDPGLDLDLAAYGAHLFAFRPTGRQNRFHDRRQA